MFLALFPVSFVHLAILTFISEFTIEMIIFEISSIDIAGLIQSSFAIFFIVQKLTYVSGAVWIGSLAISIRHIVLPLPLIPEALLAHIDSIAIGYIIFEIALIVAAIKFDKATLAFTPAIYEHSFQ